MTMPSMSWTGHQNKRYHCWEEWQQAPGNVKVNNTSMFLGNLKHPVLLNAMAGTVGDPSLPPMLSRYDL